ncbi:putative RNA-directed DNA polymerase from transposon BS [Araneus ventricosus]|uniref:Putative RNA-directed DNA polymerase from transposon BS n=1 Tax=Araneus ventricosus TaxID=182803 RepID=A0A4Y2PTT0_ARAVE|nr:putative RNA-directed DNA polymerase from transposon BS [Araneus ventricosus]
MATEYEEVTLTLEDGNTLSSEEMILRTLKEIINKWVSDITCFGICSLDNCNAKEIENKLIFEKAERKRNIPSSSSTNNVCTNSSVTSHDNVNVMSNNNNARKRAAPNESECSNNLRIRLDKDGFIYPSRRNSVPKRNLNADENSDILLKINTQILSDYQSRRKAPRNEKIQPLMISNKNNYKEMLKNLNNIFGKVNAVLANEYIKVYPETAEEHRDIQKFCREEKIEFFVVRPFSERPFKIVMKGLHRDTDIEEIKSELTIAHPEIEILKVGQLKNVRTKSPMYIFMIDLKKNGHENKIFELTHFMFLKMKIQNYRKPPGATQCWNCNMFNHSSAKFGFQTRCLKCGEDHRTNQCPIATPQETPKCINCGATGHIASWRGCPLFPKIKPTKGQGVNYPKAKREFLASQYRRQENISYSMQTGKLIPQQVELNSRQESEFNPQTDSREIGYEKKFGGCLEGVKVMYDTLKSIPNLIKTISELPMLEKTEDKLNEHLAENIILCPEQFGFRKSLIATHQLLRVVEYITSGFEKGECTDAVFLDVQKAFDRVWIQGLIHKFIRYTTPPHLLQLLKSYLEERKFAVKIGNSISEAKIMRAGIPQGGKISPVLYSLYVNDIPKTHKTLLANAWTNPAELPATKTPRQILPTQSSTASPVTTSPLQDPNPTQATNSSPNNSQIFSQISQLMNTFLSQLALVLQTPNVKRNIQQ